MTIKYDREELDTTIEPETGMQREYLALSPEERAKGLVRPVRRSYVHVGPPSNTPGDAARKGCGAVTTMNWELAETYARNPRFYGATFCVGCKTHLPVGVFGEFVWDGTDIRVGT